MIVARPKAKIFERLLNDISSIIQDGRWPFPEYNITTLDLDSLIESFPNIVEALLNVYRLRRVDLCQDYGVESLHESKGGVMVPLGDNALALMKGP